MPARVSMRAELYGARLRREADRRGVSARDLAAQIGVSEGAVSRWLAGSREISDDYRIALARALDVPILALFPPMTAAGELVA